LNERVVLFKHVLRNALIPVVTLVGLRFGYLIGGLVIVEEVFGIPGLGRLVIYSISKRDYPLVLGVVFFIALSFLIINLLVDILYAVIDPRISYEKKAE
jgi:ABC-type dipeptide/oligopeptide/nickel transport system permease component